MKSIDKMIEGLRNYEFRKEIYLNSKGVRVRCRWLVVRGYTLYADPGQRSGAHIYASVINFLPPVDFLGPYVNMSYIFIIFHHNIHIF